MAQIDRVAYERLRSFGDYENERVHAEASVGDGEEPADVLGVLKEWVAQSIAQREYAAIQRVTLDDATYAIAAKQRELDGLKERVEKLRAFLQLHGVAVDDFSDLPF